MDPFDRMQRDLTSSARSAAGERRRAKADAQAKLEQRKLERRQERRAEERQAAGAPQLPPEVGQVECQAHCAACGATITNTTQVLLERVYRNRVRCDRCGKPLTFSPVVSELYARYTQAGGADLRAEVDYRCPKCDRTMAQPLGKLVELVQRDRATCQVCGTGLEFPPVVHEAVADLSASGRSVARRTVQCPICDRGVVDDTGGSGRVNCSFCRVGFALSPQSTRGLRPPLDMPAASPDELAPFLARVSHQSPFAGELLQARVQRGEVTFAEAVVLAARLEALRAWAHSEELAVPLPPEEAAPILANLLVPGAIYHTDRQDMSEGGTLFVDLGGVSRGDVGKVATNVLSVASLAAGGIGVFFLDLSGDVVSTDLCVALTPAGDGCSAVALGMRKGGGKTKRLPKALQAKLQQVFRELPVPLAAYHLRHVLFGPWAAGQPLFLLNANAARLRLEELGLPPQRYGQALGFA